jgi:hypothetical protein
MIASSNEINDEYDPKKDNDLHKHHIADMKNETQHALFSKG